MWFKVTISKDGAVRSCEQVAGKFENGDCVYYVEAESSPLAIKAAKYLHKVMLSKASGARKISDQKRSGLCTFTAGCSNKPKSGKKGCAVCLDRKRISCKKQRERIKQGIAARPVLADRSQADIAAKYDERIGASRSERTVKRAQVLREARDAHARMTRAEFVAWLDREIRKCEREVKRIKSEATAAVV